MTKKILSGIALVAGLMSCTEDFTNWASPQSNEGNGAAQILQMTVTPSVNTIDFAEVTSETIKLFSTSLTATQASEYTVDITGEGVEEKVSIIADNAGNVQTADLRGAVSYLYGAAPVERLLTIGISTVATNETADGKVKVRRVATPYTLTAKLDAPYIAQNYYVVGGSKPWGSYKDQKFSHSGANVYDDPVFTIVIDAAASGDTWFAIGDDEGVDAIANNDWTKLFGTTKGNGNTDLTGTLAPRYELSDDGSFCVPAGPKKIKIEINMMERTFKIETVSLSDAYYLVGGPLDWAASAASKEQKFSHSDKDVFEDPVFTIVFAASEGDTWFAFGDDDACDAIGGGDWSKLFGTKGESTDLSGSFDRRYNLGGDHSFCVPAGSGKFIRLEVNMMENTYKIIPLNYQEYIYEIGNETGWQIPHALRSENFDGKYQGYYYLDGEFKFKPNADDWNGDWENDGDGRIADNGGSNMPGVGAGFYRINVDLSAMTYAVKLIEHVSIIGTVNGNWDNDTDLTYNKDEGCWEVTCDLNAGNMKFRGNHNWDGDVDLGGSFDNLVHGGSDIAIEAGNYTIKLYISVSGQHHAVVTKN